MRTCAFYAVSPCTSSVRSSYRRMTVLRIMYTRSHVTVPSLRIHALQSPSQSRNLDARTSRSFRFRSTPYSAAPRRASDTSPRDHYEMVITPVAANYFVSLVGQPVLNPCPVQRHLRKHWTLVGPLPAVGRIQRIEDYIDVAGHELRMRTSLATSSGP